MMEDYTGTGGELLFVDSAEEAGNVGKNVYAVYQAAVPANEEPVLIDGQPIGNDVSGNSLQSVEMTGAQKQAVMSMRGLIRLHSAYLALYMTLNQEDIPKEIFPVVLKELASDGNEEIIDGTGAMLHID